MLFALEIQVHCMACDAYLEFNLPQGIDLLGVTASEDKQTVRLSAQLGTPKPPIVRGFIVHHHSPGEVL
jgi:hypothetical protein